MKSIAAGGFDDEQFLWIYPFNSVFGDARNPPRKLRVKRHWCSLCYEKSNCSFLKHFKPNCSKREHQTRPSNSEPFTIFLLCCCSRNKNTLKLRYSFLSAKNKPLFQDWVFHMRASTRFIPKFYLPGITLITIILYSRLLSRYCIEYIHK